MQKISFDKSDEIGAYSMLTNSYAMVGENDNRNFYSHFEAALDIPIVETTINGVKTVGALCVGNSKGLVVPQTTTDQELLHIRNIVPEGIKVRRVDERHNAFGNIISCNDNYAIMQPDISPEAFDEICDTLGVEGFRNPIGDRAVVGTYSIMNNQGMVVHPLTPSESIEELKDLLNLRVIAGSINRGNDSVGGGAVINDWIGFAGSKSTNTEITVMESVFNLKKEDNKLLWVEELIE